MSMSQTLKAIRFEKPDYIPMSFHINDACWKNYPQQALFDLMEEHKMLFPNFVRPKGEYTPNYALVARKNEPYTDDFGCVWETMMDGITGTVTKHPLSDWENFKTYKMPNPEKCMGIGPVDWVQEKKRIEESKKKYGYASAGLRHGHTFLQLCDIRGYENLIFDMADEEKNLFELIERLEHFNMEIVKKYISFGVDSMGYAEDLGTQTGPMISPDDFRKYIKPSYTRLMKAARDAGAAIHMHSDGNIRDLCDDIIESGVEVINLQDLVNGIDWIADKFRGKICVDLDIDRQHITPFGTPKQIDELIHEEVKKLATPQGGLTMIYGLYPGVPLENVKALMDAMEKYMFYYG